MTIPENKDVSSLYLHFPFCRHLCNFCDFYKNLSPKSGSDFFPYYEYLESSMNVLKGLMGQSGFKVAPLETFYIGGGTPSLWGCEGPSFLRGFFEKHGLELSPDCEFTLEVDPSVWTKDSIQEWVKFGANRFSLGIQTYDAHMLKFLDRNHSWEDSMELLEYFQKENLNFSVDLLLGIPHSYSVEKKRDILQEIKELLKFGPKHMSLYLLTVGDGYPSKAYLPDDSYIAEEYLAVSNYLSKAGMDQYEVSNYAFEGFESKHNKKYWEFQSIMALGQSGTGILVRNDGEATRFRWKTNSPEFVTEELRAAESRLEKVYLGLRTKTGLRTRDIFCEEDVIRLETLVISWEQKNYIKSYQNGTLKLSAIGYLMLDSLMDDLFREMKGL